MGHSTIRKGKGKAKPKTKPDEVPGTEAGPSALLEQITGPGQAASERRDGDVGPHHLAVRVHGKGAESGGAAEVQVHRLHE